MATAEEVAGEELRHLRSARGWSQEEVAERMKAYGYDWHQTLVGRIETAQRPLRLNEAVDMAALFGISIEALLTRTQREIDAGRLRLEKKLLETEIERAQMELSVAEDKLEQAAAAEHRMTMAVQMARTEMASMNGRLASLNRSLEQARSLEPPDSPV